MSDKQKIRIHPRNQAGQRAEKATSDAQTVSSRLSELRKKRGYTQVRVQIETGIDQSDYSKIERGVRPPTNEQAIQLAKLFETSLDYICGLTDEPQPYPRSTQKDEQ